MPDTPSPLAIEAALASLARHRTDRQIVLTNQMSARIWPNYSDHPLDLNYNPSAMGGAVPLGLGLALSRPRHQVLVLSGDGSLLMNLGCLVTVAAAQAANLAIVLLDNQCYEVTGGQRTAASGLPLDYARIAQAVGFPRTSHPETPEQWEETLEAVATENGPWFVWAQVTRLGRAVSIAPAKPIQEQLKRLTTHLQ